MKKLLRWSIYVFVVLIILVVIAFFSINPAIKSMAEHRLRVETGMKAEIGKFDLGFRSRTVRIVDLKLTNPPEFGGSTFIHLPELYLELNPEALRENKLQFNEVRVDVAELNVIENKDGRKNTDAFQKSGKAMLPGKSSPTATTNAPADQVTFGGIDLLKISLGTARFTSAKYPNRNYERELGVRNRIFKDLKTEKDLETVGVLIMAQIGMGALLERIAAPEAPREVSIP